MQKACGLQNAHGAVLRQPLQQSCKRTGGAHTLLTVIASADVLFCLLAGSSNNNNNNSAPSPFPTSLFLHVSLSSDD